MEIIDIFVSIYMLAFCSHTVQDDNSRPITV